MEYAHANRARVHVTDDATSGGTPATAARAVAAVSEYGQDGMTFLVVSIRMSRARRGAKAWTTCNKVFGGSGTRMGGQVEIYMHNRGQQCNRLDGAKFLSLWEARLC